MTAFSDKVTIAKPKTEVFTFLTSFDNATTIMPNVVKNEILSEGPFGVGTRFRETRLIRGREASSEIEVIEYEPSEKFSVRSELEGLATLYHYKLQSTETGTEVTFECEINASSLKMKLIKPLFKRIMKKEDGDHVRRMKEAMEEENSEKS
ncbi:hypothetical protein GLW08_15700 [Pontibacillus yanchengensis]|uniref:Uncharacterized protein n=2 Tax=Pontibacillus yanchengensis TaxID=462910 RepID=A0ACC7VJI7_9BACI|nr:SRPBCC family protein [Pontibacillus yanchengensis]MYL34846.1 hypothetical protein [Pontibacillus yanchengensis]MYL54780.1 hypothetical protein [Pontibacillus yanchengensis]